VAAGQTYGARLTVVTNGGVVEVPLRMDLVAQPFARPPLHGVRTQRELAEKMRQQPKAAVPILESGEIQRWFAVNGWTYPIPGTPIKGVGGVQQFFEGMGLSKPPPLSLSQNEFRFTCKYKETIRAQATLQTKAKKWVYAQVSSDNPWLKVLNPQISGPQHATVPLEIDTNLWNQGPVGEGRVTFTANGGQRMTLKVIVDVAGAPVIQSPAKRVGGASPLITPPAGDRAANPFATSPDGPASHSPTAALAPPLETDSSEPRKKRGMKFVPALVTTVVLCLVLRVLLIPLVDVGGRSSAVAAALRKQSIEPAPDSPFEEVGGWLRLPWLPILGGANVKIPARIFQPGNETEFSARELELRENFTKYFIRGFVLWTWWLGGVAGALVVWRRGGSAFDIPWGIIAGVGAGLAGSATFAAFFLVVEMIPHTLWHLMFAGHGGSGYLVLWCLLAVLCWFIVGIGLGLLLPWIDPLRRVLIDPFQQFCARLFRIAGLKGLSKYWKPPS
jgi:hypothetical protein